MTDIGLIRKNAILETATIGAHLILAHDIILYVPIDIDQAF